MTETAVIERSPYPFTKDILVEHLQALGLQPGMTVLMHSSMSKIGYVPGGAVTACTATLFQIGSTTTKSVAAGSLSSRPRSS